MSTKFHAYAASAPHAPLEPFTFDPGALGPEEVEIQVSHCGICHSDLSMLVNEWGMSHVHSTRNRFGIFPSLRVILQDLMPMGPTTATPSFGRASQKLFDPGWAAWRPSWRKLRNSARRIPEWIRRRWRH